MSWNNFNDAEDQHIFSVIPKGTLAKVRMTLRPGGYDEPEKGWTKGYATISDKTGSVYLSAEFVVLEGPYARQKLWTLIGLQSNKGPEWGNMGRAFVKGVLNSARGIHPEDESEGARIARCIHDISELDGIEFVTKIDVEKDSNDDERNVIKTVITPDHQEYAKLMGRPMTQAQAPLMQPAHSPTSPAATQENSSAVSSSQSTTQSIPTGRPSWAQ